MQQNTIHNAVLHFELGQTASEMPRSNEVVAWAKTNILEAIDHHAENLTDTNTMVQIQALEINLELPETSNIFEDVTKVQAFIWDQVYSSLKKAIREKKDAVMTVPEYQSQIVLRYLRSGYLNEHFKKEAWDNLVTSFFDTLLHDQVLRKQWLISIQNKSAFARFFSLQNTKLHHSFIARLTREKEVDKQIEAVLTLLKGHPQHFHAPTPLHDFYRLLFSTLPYSKPSLAVMLSKTIRYYIASKRIPLATIHIPQEILAVMELLAIEGSILKSRTIWPTKEYMYSQQEADQKMDTLPALIPEGAYVGQAGLVLVAPFLATFLKNTGYLDRNGQLLKKTKIPILLHYLATGEKKAPEWKLSLPKILAGLQLGQHCDVAIRPSKKLDEKIAELLNAIIGHWEALKNTSPQGLQMSFLNRTGALKSKNGFYYLYIEEKTIDILLNYVPWNFNTIRFNWMRQILFVEWTKK